MNNEPELMSAQEARDLVRAGKAKVDQESYAKAVAEINKAIEAGKLGIDLKTTLTGPAKAKLEAKGYKVTYGNQYNESYTYVDWN